MTAAEQQEAKDNHTHTAMEEPMTTNCQMRVPYEGEYVRIRSTESSGYTVEGFVTSREDYAKRFPELVYAGPSVFHIRTERWGGSHYTVRIVDDVPSHTWEILPTPVELPDVGDYVFVFGQGISWEGEVTREKNWPVVLRNAIVRYDNGMTTNVNNAFFDEEDFADGGKGRVNPFTWEHAQRPLTKVTLELTPGELAHAQNLSPFQDDGARETLFRKLRHAALRPPAAQ